MSLLVGTGMTRRLLTGIVVLMLGTALALVMIARQSNDRADAATSTILSQSYSCTVASGGPQFCDVATVGLTNFARVRALIFNTGPTNVWACVRLQAVLTTPSPWQAQTGNTGCVNTAQMQPPGGTASVFVQLPGQTVHVFIGVINATGATVTATGRVAIIGG